jgi:hypothetical protein
MKKLFLSFLGRFDHMRRIIAYLVFHSNASWFFLSKGLSYILCSTNGTNLTTCQQDVFATGLLQACQQVVTTLLFYQVATRLSLTTYWQIVELQDDNKLLEQLVISLLSVELNNLVGSCQQAIDNLSNKLGTSSANTFCARMCARNLSTSCNNAVILSSCYTRWSLTTCRQIVELQDDNKLLEQLATSLLSSTTL